MWFSKEGGETANGKGRMQARVWRGRHLSKLLNSWRKAQFGLAVIQAACEGWRSKRIEQCGRPLVLTQSDLPWLATSVPPLKPLQGHFYDWGEAMRQSVHLTQHNRSVVLAAHISTRLQRDAIFLGGKSTCALPGPKHGKNWQNWRGKWRDMDWTG